MPADLIVCGQRLLEHHPQWGYTTEVRNDTYRSGIVMKRIQDWLTDRRAELKHIMSNAWLLRRFSPRQLLHPDMA